MGGVSVFDNVRIIGTPETERFGYASRLGVCHGFTTPSVTGVEVVGRTEDDFAIAVHFEDLDTEIWFSADLVELVDHGPGATMSVGDSYSAVRLADGTWNETTPFAKRVMKRFRRLLR
jgi:hypothetical protein